MYLQDACGSRQVRNTRIPRSMLRARCRFHSRNASIRAVLYCRRFRQAPEFQRKRCFDEVWPAASGMMRGFRTSCGQLQIDSCEEPGAMPWGGRVGVSHFLPKLIKMEPPGTRTVIGWNANSIHIQPLFVKCVRSLTSGVFSGLQRAAVVDRRSRYLDSNTSRQRARCVGRMGRPWETALFVFI